MSLLSWMFPAKKPGKPAPDSSGLSRMEPTRPVRRGSGRDSAREIPVDNAQPANRKHERMARRELLYSVVRESMVRTGVLSASYKFKVLSLDGRGRQFLVMIDLSRDCAMQTAQLGEVEAMIAQSAKSRYDIVVSSVYWRMSEHVAVGDPKKESPAALPAGRAADSSPAPLDSAPTPLEPEAKPIVTRSRYEPIREDEVAAFKKAVSQGVQNPAAAAAASVGVAHGASATAFDGSSKHGPQSYTLLTGFEDTEVAGGDAREVPMLSGTQYGDLN